MSGEGCRERGVGDSICSVCEYVVSGFHCPQCTVCNYAVHPDCCTQFGMNVAVCHRCVGERHRQIESCQRAQTTHRVATDLGRSAIRNAEIGGNVLGVSAASTVKAVVGLGRSTVRGMSSVLQRDDEDDRERTEVDADDKHDFESIGADVGETVQDNSAASQAIFHQVHTPRQELSTSSKLDGDHNGERNATRTLFSGSVFSGGHGQGTPKFAKDQGVGRVMRRNSFSGPEFSTGRQTSSFDQDTSGHLAEVLSKVNASDFPKLDFESEQSRAGAAESWMQLMEVADYWECTEHEVRGKYEMYLRTSPMARGRVQASALLEPRFQLIERRFRPIVLDAVPRTMQKMAMNAGLLGVSQVIFAVFVEAGPGSRADREQTLFRVQCPVGLNKRTILDNLFDWRFNLDRLMRMKMNVPDPSLQITTLLTIVERLTSKDPLFRHRLHTVVTENNLHGLVRQRQILEFWSYLVAEVRELEVVTVGDVRAAALIQRDEKQGSSVVEIECEHFKRDGGCRQRSLCPYKHVKLLPSEREKPGKCYNCGATSSK